jgi:hypothetical protein
VTAATPGQVAYEARQVTKGRRMGADDGTPDSEILSVIALGWDELPPGMQADEEAGAQAVLDNRTPWGDVDIVVIAMGPRCAVVRSGGPDGDVVKVISYGDARLAYYDSVEEWQAANGGTSPSAPAAPERPREGWSRIVPPQKKSHYFVKGRSLCGRYGFPPEPLNPDDYTSPDDCAGCRKKVNLRKLDQIALEKGPPA